MQPTQTLPETYHPIGTIDLSKNFRLLVWMNVLGLGLFVVSGWLFVQITYWLRPNEAPQALAIAIAGLPGALQVIIVVVVLYAGMVLLHEALHGLFFWLFTGGRPVFAFKGAYAYAAAPDWFLPRNMYFVTAVAPLVGISLLGVTALAFGPSSWFLPALVVLITNAGGAAGDLWVAGWLLRQPSNCYANDRGDGVTLYLPG